MGWDLQLALGICLMCLIALCIITYQLSTLIAVRPRKKITKRNFIKNPNSLW